MQTIDLDGYRLRKMFLTFEQILQRIIRCPHTQEIWVRESASMDGYHVKIWCDINCEMCRLAFDDPTRFSADYNGRKPPCRNVMFTVKSYKKARKTLTLKAGEWKIYNHRRISNL